jgi:sulfite reductase beta subunit-like hemoprotein
MTNIIETQGDVSQLSKVEGFKQNSQGLYGPIPDELGEATDHFSEESVQLLKHHGTYQQDDRDVRRSRKKDGLGKLYTMMTRTKFPGGKLTAEQYLVCDDISDRHGRGDMRITSRQDFQFHGVVKGNLRPLIHDLNKLAQITTLGGCGDVVRNTMANPVADIDLRYKDCGADLVELAQQLSDATLPATKSYFDLWLNDEKVTVADDGTVTFPSESHEKVKDDLYGELYLPRKFKIGIGTDFDNASDVYTQDFGVIAVTEDGRIVGYEILVGGGLGFSFSKPNTKAMAGQHFAFVQQEEIIPLLKAVVSVQRDYGNRKDRKQARLKYTIEKMGLDRFRAEVCEYAGRTFGPSRHVQPTDQPDYLGWHKQIQQGLNYVGVWVENGRVADFENSFQFKTGLRAVIERFKPAVRVTPHHNLVLANIPDAEVDAVQAMLDEYKLPTDQGISTLRRMEMACPALPLCPLATSEAERYMPELMSGLETAGYGDLSVCIRVTGCPNGCARSTSSEIGLVGKGPKRYMLRTGGDFNGTRINETLIPAIKEEEIVPTLGRLFDLWKGQADGSETFGDWSHKVGVTYLQEQLGL